MRAKERPGLSIVMILALGLAAAPWSISLDGVDGQLALAKNNGGGGNSGSHGGGHGASGNHGAAGAAGKGASAGAAGADENSSAAAPGQLRKEAALAASTSGDADLTTSASAFGRLNGFMHAAPQALENAAPNSAIGVVANAYREALSAYLGAEADDPELDADLDAAAKALALAANKELTTEVVAEVNARLAEAYGDDPALAGLSDPDSAYSQCLAEDIAALGQGYQELEANQGLGPDADMSEVDDGADGDSADGDSGGEPEIVDSASN